MNAPDMDEMLFGFPPLQDNGFDNAWLYDSEDEMLDAPFDDHPAPATIISSLDASSQCPSPLTSAHFQSQESVITGAHNGSLGLHRPSLPLRDRNWVIARVEEMLEGIVDGLLENSERLSITLKTRAHLSRRQPHVLASNDPIPDPKIRQISFPGGNAQEAWNFTVLMRILELVHSGLLDNTVMTKRDIYYRHPDLFVKQSVVDRYVDDLACTFGVSRSQLNVTAAAKGLVAGNFSILRENGTSIDGMSGNEGLIVPTIHDSEILNLEPIHWILVIEKEATFRSLLSSIQWQTLGNRGLILTAKGYPDLSSRKFLCQLAEHCPHIPMFAFVDLDPDGIAILSTYKYGSYRLAHEDVALRSIPALHLPNIHWLGVKYDHISRTPVGESDTESCTMYDAQGLMRLTVRDRKKARQMLEWDLLAEGGQEPEWRSELQKMLMLNIKAEMQILEEGSGSEGLASWLSKSLEGGLTQGSESAGGNTGSDGGLLF